MFPIHGNSRYGAGRLGSKIGLAAGLMLLLAACTPSVPAGPTATETDVLMSPVPVATATIEPTLTQTPSSLGATYRDEDAGFEFDYPAGWTVGPSEQYSRGGITAITSWSRPSDVLPGPTPAGETRLDVTVQLWEPINDLEAFVNQRQGAWEASGSEVVSHETWALSEAVSAEVFVVEGSDGVRGFFFFTVIADKYLVLSGDGDLELLAEIAGTVRMAVLV